MNLLFKTHYLSLTDGRNQQRSRGGCHAVQTLTATILLGYVRKKTHCERRQHEWGAADASLPILSDVFAWTWNSGETLTQQHKRGKGRRLALRGLFISLYLLVFSVHQNKMLTKKTFMTA